MLRDLTGTRIGRYEIVRRLGHGGMGEVYEAVDPTLHRTVALKRLSPSSDDDAGRQRLIREARHAASLNHPCIAAVHDVLDEQDEVFLVLEYVDGSTLAEQPPRPLDLDTFIVIAIQCAEALEAAHESGIIHRDIKPGNIMLTPASQVKVLDFGVAKRLPRSLEDATTKSRSSDVAGIRGTPAYMAPQVLKGGQANARSDLFSLGIVFYELLTGHNPFLDETVPATADRILHETPPSINRVNPRIPEALERTVFKMLAKDAQDRYPSAADLLVDLRHLRKVQSGEIKDWVPAERRGWTWNRRSAALVMVGVLLAGLFYVVFRDRLGTGPSGINSLPDDPILAILPFVPARDDPNEVAFTRGLTRAVNARLAHLSRRAGFAVVSPSMARRRQIGRIDQIAGEVGANLALLGRLTQDGTEYKVLLELVDEQSGSSVDGSTVRAALADTLALEWSIVQSIATLMSAPLDPDSSRQLARSGTDNSSAYRLYLQGLGHLENLGALIRAQADLEGSLTFDPNFHQARVALARSYLLDEPPDVDRAARISDEVERLDPSLVETQLSLAEVWRVRGDTDKVVAHLERARYLDPLNEEATLQLYGTYAALGRMDAVDTMLRDAVDRQPNTWVWHSLLGIHAFRSGRFPEAITEMEASAKLAPRYYRTLFSLGAAYAETGQWEKAGETLEASITVEPSPEAFTNLGTAYFWQGRFNDAIAQFETAVTRSADTKSLDFTLYGNLADALYWVPGERERAALYYGRAISMAESDLVAAPKDATVLGRISTYYAMSGDWAKAFRNLDTALAIAPDSAEMQFRAAIVYYCSGEEEKALGSLERAAAAGLLVEKIQRHPLFRALHTNPEFQRITRPDPETESGTKDPSISN